MDEELDELNKDGEKVGATLKRIQEEQTKVAVKKRPLYQTILMWVFFPITGIVLLFQYFTKKIKIRLTTKTTVIFTVLFGVLIIGYVIFVNSSISNQLKSGIDTEKYLKTLRTTSIILVALFVAIGAVLGGMASQAMLSPIRKMITKIDDISSDKLSTRLDPVDSQDELMDLTTQINNMLDMLEQSFSRQANFVSDASHELKTPLSVIQGYSNLLKRWGKENPEILNEGIEAIARESENMKHIVEQLLWLAKIGNFTMTVTKFNLVETINSIVEGYKIVNTSHQINFYGDSAIMVNTDRNLITEAVRTLIDNAIKYTPTTGGQINITCKRVDGEAHISVADNGIGISAEDLPHIFDRFYRCDKVRGREKGSCGLGLTIANSIIEMMGGTLSVESTLGAGSKFKIILY